MKTQIYLAASFLSLAALNTRAQDPWVLPGYPKDTNVSCGVTVSFRVYADSTNPPVTCQWLHEGTNLPAATNFTLIISNLTTAHAGGYMAMISNAIGGFTNSRTAILIVDPTFIKITTGPPVTDLGGSITATWIDYDEDGWLDLFVGNATGSGSVMNFLYRNEGNGTFTKITTNLLGSVAGSAWGVAWGDYDNDGRPDLYVANTENRVPSVFHNEGGGRFTRVTTGPLVSTALDGCMPLWGDYDNDGFIDLFVSTGYWSGPQLDRLYHNEGNGTFRIMTAAEVGPLASDNVTDEAFGWKDYDNDGDLDLFVVYMGPPIDGPAANYVFRNPLNGPFEKIALPNLNVARQHFGAAWGDYDNDGYVDVFLPSWYYTNALFKNLSGQGFTNVSATAGLELAMSSEGSAWGDYDNDGWLDLCVANYQGQPNYPGGQALFHNNRDGTFTRITTGSPAHEGGRTTAVAWGDYDNDGFLDLYIACGDATPQRNLFYRNNGPGSGNTNRWLKVKLNGQASNRMGIGAKIRVQATSGGQTFWQLRTITGQHSWIGDDGLLAHFGLGDATDVTTLRVEWPSGNVQELVNVMPNQLIAVTEVVNITPVRPTASLGGSVTLTRTALAGASYQWRLDGVDLVGQMNRTLSLTNLTTDMAGRYSVVASNATTLITNFVYLFVDTQFTKITTEPMCTDRGYMFGCAWGDYDDDGYSDLFVADGAWFRTTTNHLYHNNGDGTFARMTTNDVGSVVGDRGGWRGCAWGDYNNDGFLDLYVTQDNGLRHLYHNNQNGRFTRVTTNGPPVSEVGYGHGVSWGDYDSDGFLDLFVATAAGGYHGYTGGNSLYHNQGNRTFTKVTAGPIAADRPTGDATYGGAWADFDNDGDLDLVAGGGTGSKFVYRNNGAGQFSKITSGALAGDYGYPLFFSWGDYDNDGLLDLFSGEWNQQCRLFHNNSGGQFTKMLFPPGSYETRGGVWGDYDNDGYLDLFIPIGGFSPGRSLLYHNNGDGTFTQITTGSLVSDYGHASCAAWCDYDNDGFLDLFVDYCYDEPNALYHNNGNNNGWLLFKLMGTRSNRGAIGAKVKAKATIGGKTFWQMREISGGEGVQNDLRPHFGLGNAAIASIVRIEWPSGVVEEFSGIAPRQILTIVEPSLKGAFAPDGKFHLAMTMSTNRVYRLETSTDLVNWTTLTNCTGSGTCTPVEFVDPETPAAGAARFYRMK